MRHTRFEPVTYGVGNGAAKDDEIEEGISTKTVCTVDRNTSSFSASEETWNDLVIAGFVYSDDFASILCRNTAHVIMDSWEDGDGLFTDVDTGEDGGCF
jgi:hypothetical protein